jgi:hypothetical protein
MTAHDELTRSQIHELPLMVFKIRQRWRDQIVSMPRRDPHCCDRRTDAPVEASVAAECHCGRGTSAGEDVGVASVAGLPASTC